MLKYCHPSLKWNSRQKATKALFAMNMSQTFIYDERGTFKIYRSFVFGQANF